MIERRKGDGIKSAGDKRHPPAIAGQIVAGNFLEKVLHKTDD